MPLPVADTYALTPARAYAVEYGGPLVDKAREKASEQWMRHAQPTVTRVREQFHQSYDQHVSPHLRTLSELSQPVLRVGRKTLQQLYFEVLLPQFEFTKPYALQGYDAASDFTTAKAFPALHWVWSKTTAFLDKAVWPQVRMVYVENIEPQLVRIGERLERYKNRTGAGLKPKPPSEPLSEAATHTGVSKKPVESPQSTFSRPAPQSTSLPGPGAVDSQSAAVGSARSDRTVGAPWKPARAPVPSENETEQRRKAREMVSKDLDMWQNKFAAQADEGALAMEEHIDEIAQRMLFEGVAVKGHDLLRKLESTTESELELLKTRILSLVSHVSREDDAADANADADTNSDADVVVDIAGGADADADVIADEVWKQVVSAIRSAGLSIKKAARAVRDWRDTYEKELQALVLEAATVHFQILDETRGLALQQIGMKWAWTDGVTYKDWAKYHDLKKTLSEWTEELKKLIVTNPTLLQAQEASALVEDDGMAIASAAAHELARLKEVAHFKLLAKDTTDNFDLEAMKMAAEAPHKAAEIPSPDVEGEDEEVTTSSRQDDNDDEFELGEETDGSEKPRTTLCSLWGVSDEATVSPAGETDTSPGEDYMTEGQSTSDPVLPTTGFILAEGFSFESHEETLWDETNNTPKEIEQNLEQTPERIVVESDPGLTSTEAQAEILTDEGAPEALFSTEDSSIAGPVETDDAGSGEEPQAEKCGSDVPYQFTPNGPLFVTHG
ncbi:hypothetical protein ESCO_001537 [Escovopsis weberi]|uniref:Uncharacterized protein n=1 Tax=Escovopsis weberi TaxID=150374 RepID=A0A0N0RU28_ESCWE|nr:hypothetical protein ESCO_001537 [Escovopsis weberi]